MSLSAAQRAAIRRRRREDADGAAEDRWHQKVGDLMGLGFAEPVAPAIHVGWMETGRVQGGHVFCVVCSPQQPTSAHVPVYDASYFATMPCSRCGRRLDCSLL